MDPNGLAPTVRRRAPRRACAPPLRASAADTEEAPPEAVEEPPTTLAKPLAAVAGAMLLNLAVGSLYSWSVFVAPLEAVLQMSRSVLSLAFSAATVCFATTMLFGAASHAWMPTPAAATVALLFGSAGLLLAGTVKAYWALVLGYGLFFGISNGIGYGIGLNTAAMMGVGVFDRMRRGIATGLAVGSYVITPVFLAPYLREQVAAIGPHATLQGMGWAFLALSPLVYFLYQASSLQVKMPVAPPPSAVEQRQKEFSVLVRLWFACMTGAAAGLMTISHAIGIMSAYGGLPTQLAAGVSLAALGNWAGRIISGWAADHRDGPKWILVAGTLITSLSLFALSSIQEGTAASPAMAGVAPLATLISVGLCYGAVMTGFPSVTTRLLGAENFGRVYGRVFTAWGVAGLIAPIIAGYLYDTTGTYATSLRLAGAVAAISSAIVYWLPNECDPEEDVACEPTPPGVGEVCTSEAVSEC